MAKSTKGARNIVVGDVTFRWRAGRKWGGLSLVVWPVELPGPPIVCSFSREDLAVPTTGDPALDLPIVITNRIVRRVIKLAVGLAYDPRTKRRAPRDAQRRRGDRPRAGCAGACETPTGA
jgi:hypothetical protein